MPGGPAEVNPVAQFVRDRWLALLLIVLTVAFVVQNRDRPSIDLFFLSVSPPQWVVMSILFAIGWFVGAYIHPRRKRS
jgi:uncharacterized integral membrane protein